MGEGRTDDQDRAPLTGALPRAFRFACLSAAYAVASGLVLDVFLSRWGAELGDGYAATLRFEAPRPYVHRVLVPALVDVLTALVPDRLGAAWTGMRLPRDRAGTGALAHALAEHHFAGPPNLSVAVGIAVLFAALWGTLWTWRALLTWAIPGRPLLAAAAPVVGILALPATFVGGGFLYDFPDLFLVSVAAWAFARGRWGAWYAVLPLVVLDKDASVLVVAWFFAAAGELPRRRFAIHAAASAALGTSIVAALAWVFRGAPGTALPTNLGHNLAYWASLRWLVATDDLLGLGVVAPVATHFVNLAFVCGLWFYGRRRVPRLVERMFFASVGAVLPFFLLSGFENEVRVFAIAFPSLFLLGVGAADALASGAPRGA